MTPKDEDPSTGTATDTFKAGNGSTPSTSRDSSRAKSGTIFPELPDNGPTQEEFDAAARALFDRPRDPNGWPQGATDETKFFLIDGNPETWARHYQQDGTEYPHVPSDRCPCLPMPYREGETGPLLYLHREGERWPESTPSTS